MTRALVLSGGGPVGIGWETGLLVGLAECGVDVKQADAVVGTSAGSVVGFAVSSKWDLAASRGLVTGADNSGSTVASPSAADAQVALAQFVQALGKATLNPETAVEVWTEMGSNALAAQTISEGLWLERFLPFAGVPWPPGFSCTALSTVDGSFQIWDTSAHVDPQRALASSCAVPGLFPPVTVGDVRWMDGGGRDIMNADVAAGHDVVLAVSCVPLEVPAEFSTPAFDAILAAARAQLDSLRLGGSTVVTIVPGEEMLHISGAGADLLDFSRAEEAYEAGQRQGQVEAERIGRLWS